MWFIKIFSDRMFTTNIVHNLKGIVTIKISKLSAIMKLFLFTFAYKQENIYKIYLLWFSEQIYTHLALAYEEKPQRLFLFCHNMNNFNI